MPGARCSPCARAVSPRSCRPRTGACWRTAGFTRAVRRSSRSPTSATPPSRPAPGSSPGRACASPVACARQAVISSPARAGWSCQPGASPGSPARDHQGCSIERDDRMITVVGESLVDVVARQDHDELTVHPGGSPANVAVALSRLGQRTALVTQIGADDYGVLIRTHLERNGVGVILAGPPGPPTSRALATLDARGAASYEFELSWDVRGLRLAEGSAAVHIGSLGVMLAPGGEQVLRLAEAACRQGGVVVSYDPNARPSVTPDHRPVAATAERAAACAHIVKMSDEDLAFLFPGATPAQLAARLLGGGRPTQLLIITMGHDGATVVTRSERFAVPAVPGVVVDPVGAS